MSSPGAVAHIVVPMHLSLARYNTSSTFPSKFSGKSSLAAVTIPEVAACRYLSGVSFGFGRAGPLKTDRIDETLYSLNLELGQREALYANDISLATGGVPW